LKTMQRIALAILALALSVASAAAQNVPRPTQPQSVNGAYNAAPPTCVDGSGCWFQTDVNGNLKVAIASGGGSGGTASTFDAAFPAVGTAIGISDGTNMKSLLAAIALGDGVNGNNTAAVASWLWNGATYDRARGDLTSGAWVNVKADATAAATLAAIEAPIPPQTTNAVNIGAVMNAGSTYETIAASQTGQILGSTGAIGDYLSHCVIYPTTTTPGVVTVFDDASAAGTNVIAFPGGASSVSNLVPIAIPVGAVSVTGEWRVTTGANLVVTCYGKFT
jgi:hypothetical protein